MGELLITLRETVDEFLRVRWSDLHFAELRTALLVAIVLLAIAVLGLVAQLARSRRPGRAHIVMPALVSAMRRSPWSGFSQEDVSYPGRRIALLVDASTSMIMEFQSAKLNKQGTSTFFTAVAGAEAFMRRRMNGPYHDLISLIQFGNEAYVVTPFTNDYENVLLSIRLVSDPKEWGRFSDWGTTIIEGIDQALNLFKAFEFTNASGNLMIVFTDGRDSELNRQGRPLDALVAEARRYRIPVYMIRTAYKQTFGKVQQDKIWKDVVERTGGRFYPANDEQAIYDAIREIDRLSPGKIEVRQYSVQRPRYAGFALAAVACWLLAALMKLGLRSFSTFP